MTARPVAGTLTECQWLTGGPHTSLLYIRLWS